MSSSYLLDPEHRSTLENWARGATLFVFDYDGTLAPASDDPHLAEMQPEVARSLEALARRAPVAVISGRTRVDLLKRLPSDVQWVLGNHGNEGLPRHAQGGEDQAQLCAAWHDYLMGDASLWRDAHGATIENKGRSLTLNYREATNPVLARSRLLARAVKLVPAPRIVRGADSLDLLPPQSLSKDEVIELLMRECDCEQVVVVSDDVSDDALFQEAPDNWLTVHMGMCVHTDARFILRNMDEVHAFLFHAESLRQAQGGRMPYQQHAAP
ncbi:MAG: trehalose-phosphatase [Aquabacterium sp.]